MTRPHSNQNVNETYGSNTDRPGIREDTGPATIDGYVIDAAHVNVNGDALSAEAYPGDELGYWHAMISDRQRTIYDEIWEHVSAGEIEFHIGSTDDFDEDLTTATSALVQDHPEIFWWYGSFGYHHWDEPGQGLNLRLNVLYDPSEWESVQVQMDAAVEEFAATVTDDMPDWERAVAVWEWLGRNVDYDYDAAYGEGEENEANLAREQSAATALVDRLSVCAGYSKAYMLLLRRVGVPCADVVGDAGLIEFETTEGEDGQPARVEKDGGHEWNIIWVCGEAGYSDATWGDRSDSSRRYIDEYYANGAYRHRYVDYDYRYFFMTTREMLRFNHVIDPEGHQGAYAWEVSLLPDCSVDVEVEAPDPTWKDTE